MDNKDVTNPDPVFDDCSPDVNVLENKPLKVVVVE